MAMSFADIKRSVRDSNPRYTSRRIAVFKTAAFDHSANAPCAPLRANWRTEGPTIGLGIILHSL